MKVITLPTVIVIFSCNSLVLTFLHSSTWDPRTLGNNIFSHIFYPHTMRIMASHLFYHISFHGKSRNYTSGRDHLLLFMTYILPEGSNRSWIVLVFQLGSSSIWTGLKLFQEYFALGKDRQRLNLIEWHEVVTFFHSKVLMSYYLWEKFSQEITLNEWKTF